MAQKSPEIQVWIAECNTQEERDGIADRSAKIEGCTVLFRGKDDEGKFVVIKSSTGKALMTPAGDFYGYKPFPEGPRTEMLAKFMITADIKIEEDRL